MTIENISWSNLHERMLLIQQGQTRNLITSRTCIQWATEAGLFSCLHNILWTSGWILTKFAWIYNWDITKNWLDFGDLNLIFQGDSNKKNWKFCDTSLSAQYLLNQWLNSYQIFRNIQLGYNRIEFIFFRTIQLGYNRIEFKFSGMYNWDITNNIGVWWPCPNFQGHSSRKTEKNSWCVLGGGGGGASV